MAKNTSRVTADTNLDTGAADLSNPGIAEVEREIEAEDEAIEEAAADDGNPLSADNNDCE